MISINFTLFIQIAHFLLLVWIMNRFLIKPVLAHIKERDQELDSKRQAAKSAVDEAKDREQAYLDHMKQARVEAGKERDKLLSAAAAEAAQLRDASAEEGRKMLDKVRSEIAASMDDLRASLANGEDDMAEDLAAAYLGRKS